jgi:hypothetical protein
MLVMMKMQDTLTSGVTFSLQLALYFKGRYTFE